MNSFEIRMEYYALNSLLEEFDPVTGELLNSAEDIKEYIDKLEASRDDKLINIERYKRDIKGSVDTLSNEIKRLQELKKQKENKINKLIDLQMLLTDGQKVETDFYSFNTRKSRSINIIDPSLVDSKYQIFQPVKIDKKLITDDIKNGVEVAGAELIEKVSLSVR